MRYALALTAGLVCLPLQSQAALSGYYDSAEQIQTILGSSDLADRLGQMPIESLERSEAKDGLIEWEVETEGCDVSVFLRAIRPQSADGAPMIGKTRYEIERIGTCG